ncbi:ribonuclease P protein subunit p38 [Stigmatopora argus]
MDTPLKSKKKKDGKNPIRFKMLFTSPLMPNWNKVSHDDTTFILNTLQHKFTSIGLQKKEVKVFRPWRKKQAPAPPSASVSDANKAEDLPKGGWTDVTARRQLALGINEVTKALERNVLQLVLVCTSVNPKHMTDHLIGLSVSRGVPACQVARLSEFVTKVLGLKSVLALGFRRGVLPGDHEVFADTVEAILPKVPSINGAWLHGLLPGVGLLRTDTAKEEKVEKRKGKKRNLEPEVDVQESSSNPTLQPLNVKKIVANPAKKKRNQFQKKTK